MQNSRCALSKRALKYAVKGKINYIKSGSRLVMNLIVQHIIATEKFTKKS